MPRGGARAGAGRPKGAATKKTAEIANKAAQEGITPLEFMLDVLRDTENSMTDRFEAAKAAAPYMHPRLATVDVGNKNDEAFKHTFEWLPPAS